MPLDGKGMYRHNNQVAKMHGGGDAAGREGMKNKILDSSKESGAEEGGEHTEVHNHGDGTFHTVHGGEQTEHESIGHMHAHLSKIHGQAGEKHFHAHHDGFEPHSHSVETGGEPEHQEHDPANIEAVKEHLGRFFDEEKHEGGDEEGQEAEPTMSSALGM